MQSSLLLETYSHFKHISVPTYLLYTLRYIKIFRYCLHLRLVIIFFPLFFFYFEGRYTIFVNVEIIVSKIYEIISHSLTKNKLFVLQYNIFYC